MVDEASPLDLQSAADRLGVHYQTAYRWVRSGRLPAQLVDGRYLVDDAAVEELARARARPHSPPPPSTHRIDSAAASIQAALVEGDEAHARRIARSIVDDGTTVTELIRRALVPALRTIGQDWHDGTLPIWKEHRASVITERVLAEVSRNPRGRRRGTAMVAAVAGDLHSLPTAMAVAALREHNWAVHHLGADVPVDELVDFCTTTPTDVAVLTVTNPDCTATAADAERRISATSTKVLIGAPGRSLDDLLTEALAALSRTRTAASAR